MRIWKYQKTTILHYLWHDDLKFLPSLVSAINNPDYHLYSEAHCFVTPFMSVYKAIENHPNAFYFDGGSDDVAFASLINGCIDCADWHFFHGAVRKKVLLHLDRRLLHKVIFRSWGGDLLFNPRTNLTPINKVKHLLSSPLNAKLRRIYRKFYLIGTANVVDDLYLRSNVGCVRTLQLGYLGNSSVDHIALAKRLMLEKREASEFKVLIGHAGTPGDNHLKLLSALKRFDKYNLSIILVLSYGDPDYINEVSAKARSLYSNKVQIINHFLSTEDYAKLISTIDVALMDDLRSSALGTLSWLVSFNKCIYINSESLYREAFDVCRIPYRLTDDISSMTFEEFARPVEYEIAGLETELGLKDNSYYVELWRDLLDELLGFHG